MSRKRFGKTVRAPLGTPHIDDWQVRARALGWPQRELDSAQSLVAVGANLATTRVTFVDPRVIELVTDTTTTFSGTDRDGVRTERVKHRYVYFAWTRDEMSDGNNIAQSSHDPDAVNTAIACDILIANDACTPVAAAAKSKTARKEKHVLEGQRKMF